MRLTPADHAIRRTGIGSSDIAKIAGIARWGSKYDVYLDKRGLLEPRPETLQTRIGHVVEDLIAELYAEETGATLETCATQRHPDPALHWVVATRDRRVAGSQRIVEIKWVNHRVAHQFMPAMASPARCVICNRDEGAHWGRDAEDAVPDDVRAQCEWLMLVTGEEECHVAALLAGEDFRIYRVHRLPGLSDRLLEIGRAFWFDHVVAGVAPPIDGSDDSISMVNALHPRHTRPIMLAPPESFRWIKRWLRSRRIASIAERHETEAEAYLRAIIGDAEGMLCEEGKFTCRLAKGNKRRTFRFWERKG